MSKASEYAERVKAALHFNPHGSIIPVAHVTPDGNLGFRNNCLSPEVALAFAAWIQETFADVPGAGFCVKCGEQKP